MIKMVRTLPENWKIKKLGEICDIAYGKGLQLKELKKNGFPVFGANGIIGFNEKYLFEEEQVLISCRGAASGKINISPPKCFITNNSLVITVKQKKEIDKKYLFYALQVTDKKKLITGTAQPQVTINNAVELEIRYPDIELQKYIVSKIEELFNELDQGIEKIQSARQKLKTYRHAVLKWAFEGKLTYCDVTEGELPNEWKWVKMGELMESVRNGYSRKPDEAGIFKILRISSVRPNKVNIDDFRYLKTEIGLENSLCENDLLFTRYNGSIDFVGVCGRVPKLNEKLFYPDKLIRCRPKLKIWFHSAYIDYAVNSRLSRQYVLSKIKTTAGQTGISGSDVKEIPIPLAPIKDQLDIVLAIENRLSVADKMEENITQSLQQTEMLRQSILKKAFEGKIQ